MNFEVKKHWWFWVAPVSIALVISFFIVRDNLSIDIASFTVPILIILWTGLRWQSDKIEIKDGYLYSQRGLFFIDRKTIPIEQISFVSEKTNIISQSLGFGSIVIQSSAFAKEIDYPYISNPGEFVKAINEAKKEVLCN